MERVRKAGSFCFFHGHTEALRCGRAAALFASVKRSQYMNTGEFMDSLAEELKRTLATA